MKKANPALIGGFVLGAMLLAAMAVIYVGGSDIFVRKRHAVIYFSGAVTGLSVGAPVNFRGVRVGQVDDIRVQFDAKTLAARIPVYVTITPNRMRMSGGDVSDVPFEDFIKNGLRAKLAVQSLVTGQLAVELDFRPNTPMLLVGNDPKANEIPAVRSDFDVFRDQLSEVPLGQTVQELRDTMAAVRQVAATANTELTSTADSARQTAETLNREIAKLEFETARTLGSVRKLSDDLDQQVVTLSPQLRDTLTAAQHALEHADATLAHTAQVTAPGAPERADLEEALHNLAIASEAMRSFAETIDRNPQAVITGRSRR